MIPLKKSYKAFAYRFYSHFTQQCKKEKLDDGFLAINLQNTKNFITYCSKSG